MSASAGQPTRRLRPTPEMDRAAAERRRTIRRFCGFATVLLSAVLAATAITSIDLPRGALWRVVGLCGFMQRHMGFPFPCFAVETGPDGFAVLLAPGSDAHFIVTPTDRLIGLESPATRSGLARPAWRGALAVRTEVMARAAIPRGNVVLSINPRRARGQDQFHIHVGCGDPELLTRLRQIASKIGPDWTRLARRTDDKIFWARRIEHGQIGDEDPFASLRSLPGGQIDPGNVVFEAFGAEQHGSGDFLHFATQTAGSSAEDALDVDCGGS